MGNLTESALPDGLIIRRGPRFIRVEFYDDALEEDEYEIWAGHDETGIWESLTFESDYERACAVARRLAKSLLA